MALNRIQQRMMSVRDKYNSGHEKPPTRAQAKAWLTPIRKAFCQIKSGEVDSLRGYPVTRMHWIGDDYARIDHCINGFVALIDRLAPDFDTAPMKLVAKKLEYGILLAAQEVDACFSLLNRVEDMLITFPRSRLVDAAKVEQINIELERLNLK